VTAQAEQKHELSPQQLYDRRRAIFLDFIGRCRREDILEYDAFDYALTLLEATRYKVLEQEKAYHTQYYCALCYEPIPRGEVTTGRYMRAQAHKTCVHIVDVVGSMTEARKWLQKGRLQHTDCHLHKAYKDCPILDHGQPLPQIGEKRSVLAEQRQERSSDDTSTTA
jgi:hypothetical protein